MAVLRELRSDAVPNTDEHFHCGLLKSWRGETSSGPDERKGREFWVRATYFICGLVHTIRSFFPLCCYVDV